jgi:exodeoxyribonuclease V alpha subunit
MANSTPSKSEQLHGIVKTLTYFNSENGYFIAKVTLDGKGERTVVGNTPVINVGEHLSAQGSWQTSNWGPQFKAAEVTLSAPTMLEGIEKYLSSAIEGIGKGYAKKMVNAFGESIFEVIETSPEKLYDVPGIGKKRATSIIAAYQEQQAVREIMVFLHRSGLSATKAHRVYKKYGDRSIEKIKENPYILCQDLWGIGFSTADIVAQKQGIPPDSDYRVCAGIQHVLREAEGFGSCGLPIAVVREKTSALLELDYSIVNKNLDYELSAGNLVKDTAAGVECLFLPKIYAAEQFIAKKLLSHAARAPVQPLSNLDQLINDAEVEIGIVLDETQREAVRVALGSNVCVITGGPGTGKTTITRVILKVFADNGLDEICLCAPTGKAAKRAAESTGFPAKTVHRTLEIGRDGQFKFNAENPLECDVWALDEWSMGDVRLMSSVCYALSATTRIILIGDVDQLPSVGPGKVLSDMIESRALATVRLTKIFRQAATSDIIKNAHAINAGELPDLGWREGSDFCFTAIAPKDPQNENDKKRCREDIESEVLRVARDMYKLGYDPIRDVQVLAPMRKGVLGVESLNVRLQAMLNPHPSMVLEALGTKWGVGDKVMQLRNNYEKLVYNGDVGYVLEVDKTARTVSVEFDDLTVVYKAGELDELTLAYAFTIHKSQGSEFPVVVMPLDYSHYTMLKRNLFYTGITRAKKLCVVVGQPAAARVAVRTAQHDERYSTLKERLMKTLPSQLREQG